MFCSQCGQQIDEDSRFCRFCGAAQTPAIEAGDVVTQKSLAMAENGTAAVAVEGAAKRKSALISGAVVFGLLLLLIIGMSRIASSGSTTDSSLQTADNPEAAADALVDSADNATAAPAAQPADPWSYSTDEDKVRRATTYYAQTTSANSIHQGFPYDAQTTASLIVRKSPAYGTDVLFTISSGQLLCRSWDGCSGTASFDGGAPQRIGFNAASDNSSETIFVVGAKSFIAKLKRAKKVVVEVELYQAGRPQFEFDVQGLKWEH